MTLFRSLVFGGVLIAVAPAAVFAQPCNPAVDGTYCAEAGVRRSQSTTLYNTSPRFSLGEALGPGYDTSPATIGAITFGTDGSRCIGLMRRSRCKD